MAVADATSWQRSSKTRMAGPPSEKARFALLPGHGRTRSNVPVRHCQFSSLESTLALIAGTSLAISNQQNAMRKFPVSSTIGEADIER